MNLENRKAEERETRPPPETEARVRLENPIGVPGNTALISTDFAIKLERERDEARENNGRNAAMLARTLIERDAARRERDRLLEALKALIDAPDYRKLSEFSQQELAAWAEARQAVAAVEGSAS